MSNDEVVKIKHKRGLGRPAPGELEAGEIGINISSVETDKEVHGLWDSYIIEPARAYTADEEGKLHAIGDWESLAPSPVQGDIAYQTAWINAADTRVRPGWQQALMSYKNFLAFENEFDKTWFPIPAGGENTDIDREKYLHNFAAIKMYFSHGRYTNDKLNPTSKPSATLRAGGLYEQDDLEPSVSFTIDCLSLTIDTNSMGDRLHNTALFVDTTRNGKDLSVDGSGTYPTAQTFVNAPLERLNGGHSQIHPDYCEKPDAALCVYGDAAVMGGTIKATSNREPTTPEKGMMYFSTHDHKFWAFNGMDWIQFANPDKFHTHDEYARADHSHSGLWEDVGGNSYQHTGHVEVIGGLLSAQPDAGFIALSLGNAAGALLQGRCATAAGSNAGRNNQQDYATAVGADSGKENQGWGGVAIGYKAAMEDQAAQATAVGASAGGTNQGSYGVAVGASAAATDQGSGSVAIGSSAAETTQGDGGVAIGTKAAKTSQGLRSIAIGESAGEISQGRDSIAIGVKAGVRNQGGSGIIISSGGYEVTRTNIGHIVIHSPAGELNFNGVDKWEFHGGAVKATEYLDADGNPKTVSPAELIETLSTLRDATQDETTVEGLRDSIGNAIGGLIEKFESRIAAAKVQYNEA